MVADHRAWFALTLGSGPFLFGNRRSQRLRFRRRGRVSSRPAKKMRGISLAEADAAVPVIMAVSSVRKNGARMRAGH